MYKLAVLGDRESVLGFMSLGFRVEPVSDVSTAEKTLSALVKSEEFGVIFITERLAMQMEPVLEKYKNLPLPAIVTIPGQGDHSGYGMNNIRSAVERAIGADILFRE